jgi:hypothetical protein
VQVGVGVVGVGQVHENDCGDRALESCPRRVRHGEGFSPGEVGCGRRDQRVDVRWIEHGVGILLGLAWG